MAISKEKLSALFLVAILAVMIGAVVVMASALTSDPLEETLAKNEVVKTLLVINDGEGNALVTDVFAFYPPYNKGALFDIPGNIGDIFEGPLSFNTSRAASLATSSSADSLIILITSSIYSLVEAYSGDMYLWEIPHKVSPASTCTLVKYFVLI